MAKQQHALLSIALSKSQTSVGILWDAVYSIFLVIPDLKMFGNLCWKLFGVSAEGISLKGNSSLDHAKSDLCCVSVSCTVLLKLTNLNYQQQVIHLKF